MLNLKVHIYSLPVAQAKAQDPIKEPTEAILVDSKLSPTWDFEAGLVMYPNGSIEWIPLKQIEILEAKKFFESFIEAEKTEQLFTDEELEYIRDMTQNYLGEDIADEDENDAKLRQAIWHKL